MPCTLLLCLPKRHAGWLGPRPRDPPQPPQAANALLCTTYSCAMRMPCTLLLCLPTGHAGRLGSSPRDAPQPSTSSSLSASLKYKVYLLFMCACRQDMLDGLGLGHVTHLSRYKQLTPCVAHESCTSVYARCCSAGQQDMLHGWQLTLCFAHTKCACSVTLPANRTCWMGWAWAT
jgi:hypothetical protein